jgi:hypothetical protein
MTGTLSSGVIWAFVSYLINAVVFRLTYGGKLIGRCSCCVVVCWLPTLSLRDDLQLPLSCRHHSATRCLLLPTPLGTFPVTCSASITILCLATLRTPPTCRKLRISRSFHIQSLPNQIHTMKYLLLTCSRYFLDDNIVVSPKTKVGCCHA